VANRIMKAPVEVPDKEPEDVATTLQRAAEGKTSIAELCRLVGRFEIKTLALILGILASVYGLGYGSRVYTHPDNAAQIKRMLPDSIVLQSASLAGDAQEMYPWLVPVVAFLEDEAAAEKAAGQWKDIVPILFRSKPVSEATSEFGLRVWYPKGNISGYAYRVFKDKPANALQYQPLEAISGEDDGETFRIPQLNTGDSLLFVLKLSSNQRIDTTRTRLLPTLIQTQVTGD
jgi:hypothetical protein